MPTTRTCHECLTEGHLPEADFAFTAVRSCRLVRHQDAKARPPSAPWSLTRPAVNLRGVISTEPSAVLIHAVPSCTVTCSCMLRSASLAKCLAFGRVDLPDHQVGGAREFGFDVLPPDRRAAGKAVDAHALGAACGLHAGACRRAGPRLSSAGSARCSPCARARPRPRPRGPWRIRGCPFVVGRHVEREGQQADHHAFVGLRAGGGQSSRCGRRRCCGPCRTGLTALCKWWL